MRPLRVFRQRMSLFILVLLAFASLVGHTYAQSSSSVATDPNATDRRAFAALFRRAVILEQMAQAAEVAGKPKPHLRRNLSTQFEIGTDDSASLLREAQAWSAETAPIQREMAKAVAAFRSGFPDGIAQKGMARPSPAALGELQAKLDAVTLRHRDLLHNAMREDDFQRVQGKVRDTFGRILTRDTTSDKDAEVSR